MERPAVSVAGRRLAAFKSAACDGGLDETASNSLASGHCNSIHWPLMATTRVESPATSADSAAAAPDADRLLSRLMWPLPSCPNWGPFNCLGKFQVPVFWTELVGPD